MKRFFEVGKVHVANTFDMSKKGKKQESFCQATITINVNGDTITDAGEGLGPFDAIYMGMMKILLPHFPELKKVKMYRYDPDGVDVEKAGSGAKVRTVIGLKYNGGQQLFEGESRNVVKSGAIALARGFNACLAKLTKPKKKKK